MKEPIKNIARHLRFHVNLMSLFLHQAKKIITSHHDIRAREILLQNQKRLLSSLCDEVSTTKTSEDSKNIYENYGNREIIEYFNDSGFVIFNNNITKMTYMDQRKIRLSYIFQEIDDILKTKEKVTILEVGCGNCINIYEIIKKYKNKVEIHGIDIAAERIKEGVSYFDKELSQAQLRQASITEITSYSDNQFDLVFSIHCIEQISYETKPAICEMFRVTSKKIIMIEPVFENGTFLQKTCLMVSDHTRILLKSIHELHLPLTKSETLSLQSTSNQSTLLIIDKS